jgi:N-acetylglucosaminyldiphosphoundecaprenol N-acetyl-beta-D-mannosaminyltransferase
MKNEKVNILNINVSAGDAESILNEAVQLVDNNKKFYICTVNAYLAVKANEDRELLKILNNAGIVIPDGMPLVWYSRLSGKPIPERISGYEFFYNFSNIANKNNYSYFFFGGTNDIVLAGIKNRLEKEFENIKVKGLVCPPIMDTFPDEFDDYVISAINKCKPDILWVGLSAPKQEKWIYKNIDRLNIRMAFGIGAAFNFYANIIKRAPLWMQKAGLEWLYRIFMEPKRLFKKYLINNTRFIILIFKDLFRKVFYRGKK